jgi:hypothetical protein
MNKYMKYIRPALFALVTITALWLSLYRASSEVKPEVSNDERNWTGVSIAAYQMYFKNHMRSGVVMDTWFTTYAVEQGIDTASLTPYQRQWYDFALWTFGWKAPNMGKFLMGSAIYTGAKGPVDPNGYYERGRADLKEDTNIFYSRVPEELIYLARKPNAVMNGLAIALVFLTGWIFLNFWSGFIASVYLLANKLYFSVNIAAGLDSPSIFFWVLAVLFLALNMQLVFKRDAWWKILVSAAVTGAMFGLAVASKLNAAMFGYVCLFVFPLAGLAMLMGRKKGEKGLQSAFGKGVLSLVISGLFIASLGPLIFVQLNPQVQGDTVKKVNVIQLSVDEFFRRRANSQMAKNRQARKILSEVTFKKPEKAMSLITRRNFVVENPEKYYGTLGTLLPFKGNVLDGFFMLVGLISMAWIGVRQFLKDKIVGGKIVLLFSFLVMVYGMAQFIWIDFARYHMAIYPGMALAIGYGIHQLVAYATSKWAAAKSQLAVKKK